MNETLRYDAELGYVPAIPEPFWYRGWRTLFRERPQCLQCDEIFANRSDWDKHYVLIHCGARAALTNDPPPSEQEGGQ